MTLFQLYYNPVTDFDRLLEDTLTNRLCPIARAPSAETRHITSLHRDVYRPRLDLHESTDTNTVTVTFELPGLASERVAIDVSQNRLTVSGESAAPEPEGEGSYVVRERRSGKFSRTLQLPFGTKPEDVTAKMENGILTVTFSKVSPEQQTKRIPIH